MINYKTMFVDTNYKLKKEAGEGYHLQVKIEENESCVILKAATMCFYLKDNLLAMLKKKYPNKECIIGYNSDISIGFYTYREFIKDSEL